MGNNVFQNEFTLGHSTTQRAESWNGQLKCLKERISLAELLKKCHSGVVHN